MLEKESGNVLFLDCFSSGTFFFRDLLMFFVCIVSGLYLFCKSHLLFVLCFFLKRFEGIVILIGSWGGYCGGFSGISVFLVKGFWNN